MSRLFMNILSYLPDASGTVKGIQRNGTVSEAQAGALSTVGVTPAGLNATVLGMGQAYQDVTASRASGVTYTNSTGRTIWVSAWGTTTSTVIIRVQAYVAGVGVEDNQWYSNGGGSTISGSARFAVPPGATYSITFSNVTLVKWFELR